MLPETCTSVAFQPTGKCGFGWVVCVCVSVWSPCLQNVFKSSQDFFFGRWPFCLPVLPPPQPRGPEEGLRGAWEMLDSHLPLGRRRGESGVCRGVCFVLFSLSFHKPPALGARDSRGGAGRGRARTGCGNLSESPCLPHPASRVRLRSA